jgi:hypothetical protein
VLFFDQPAGAEALTMANQAYQDWSHFLALRALDLDAFVKDFVGFVRAFGEPSLRAALNPEGGEAIESSTTGSNGMSATPPRPLPSRCM